LSSSEIAEARGFLEELRGPMPAQELARRRGAVDTCEIYFDWNLWALDKQRPPEGDWTTWLLLGGRGAGKTRAGAEWVRSLAAQGIGPIALVGMTMTEAVSIMVRGESGILAVHPDRERPVLKGHDLVWPNGVEATVMSASDPERFRGPQFAAAWCDELAKWPRAEEAWDQLQFGLRLGDRPRQLATTTPRPSRLLRRLLDDPHAVVTHKGRLAAFRMADATECQRNEVDFEAGEGPGIGRELEHFPT
jgi:phage terminase large subunit-like protein